MTEYVKIRCGNKIEEIDIKEVLDDIIDFAIMSSNIYIDSKSSPKFVNLDNWQRLDLNLHPRVPLPHFKRQKLITGLKYEIWSSERSEETYITIVFKGTTPRLITDWICNLRWLTLNPWLRSFFSKFVWDYYHQVQILTPQIIKAIKEKFKNKPIKFISTGHSLGGGLAQQAAYACNDIKKVVVFNPSPVTGYKDIKIPDRLINQMDIQISRVYNSGEILSYLRGFIRRYFLPLSTVNPCIKEYKFSILKGFFTNKHSIEGFVIKLIELRKQL